MKFECSMGFFGYGLYRESNGVTAIFVVSWDRKWTHG